MGLDVRAYSGRGMKLATHVHLIQRLRMRGAIPPLPYTSSWHCACLSNRTVLPGQLLLFLHILETALRFNSTRQN
jgi:hypothetical protein